MNTSYNSLQNNAPQARYGLRVAARLSAGLGDGLPHDIAERLRVARQQAVAQRKQPQPRRITWLRPASSAVSPRHGGVAALHPGSDDGLSLWGWLTSGALALALVCGLVTINVVQNDDSAVALANLDADLLTDDLPPEAYADPGFLQYLKSSPAPSVTQ
jgi:hypothetical protein